jgi:hypothetical protein
VIGNRGEREVGNEELGLGEFEERGSGELEIGKEGEEDRPKKRIRDEDFPWFEEAQRAKQTLTISKQKTSVTVRNHMLISLLSVSLFVYVFHLFWFPLNLLRLSTCSHDYSDTSVIVTQPNSINSYPG